MTSLAIVAPTNISRDALLDRLVHWTPDQGKPFEWLPDQACGSKMVWFDSLSPEVKDEVDETTWWYIEMRYRLHLLRENHLA